MTLLYFDGCPNWQMARDRLQQAVDRLGAANVAVEHRRVTSAEAAERLAFRGSPTILVDGQDVLADANAPVGLSCRVYRTDAGLEGAPSIEELIRMLDASA